MKITKKQKVRSRWLSAALMVVGAMSMLNVMALQLNIYNVTDSARTVQVKTFSDDPVAACSIAGFSGDEYAVVSDSGEEGIVRTLSVEKKFFIRILVDGQVKSLDAVSGTTRELLAQAGITLGALDEVTPAADEQITSENARGITVVRVTQETETARVTIPYETVKRNTSELAYGETRVTQTGADGESEQTIRVTKRDGVESARELVSEDIVTEPQQEILESGTGGAVITRGGDALRYTQVIDVKATAYSTEGWSHENKYTKIGTLCRVGAIAVDPKVIPLGSRLYITSPDGESWVYGTAVAEDTGSAIKGNRIDLYYNTQAECERFGVRAAKVYVLA